MNRSRKFLVLWSLLLSFTAVRVEAYERIISFRPNVTEILFTLGLGIKVVGVTTFCRHPPEALKIDKIGGYFNRRLEKILSLKPDLVVMVPDATTPRIEAALKRAKIETLVVSADSIEDVYDSILSIATKNGISDRGRRLVEEIKKQISDKAATAAALPRKKALFVIQRRPLITAGARTFLNSLLQLAGGENVAATSSLPYPLFSMETVITREPDVIIDLDQTDPEKFWSRYPSLPAVRNNAVQHADADLFVPGPRMPEALAVLIENLHMPPRSTSPSSPPQRSSPPLGYKGGEKE